MLRKGRLGEGRFPANEAKIHPSAFCIHPCSSGDVHYLQKEEDEWREKVLSALGLRIIRFGNYEVMMGLYAVVGKIKGFINLW